MQSFETTIFDEYYTLYDKLSDPNKDADGKGTQERFCETWGAMLDIIIPYIDDLNKNTIVPNTRQSPFVAYAEQDLGYLPEWIWFPKTSITFRKHLAGIMRRIYEIRHTPMAHEVMFAWLGMTVVITEDFNYDAGLDSPITFDDPIRLFDSYLNHLIPYEIALTGPVGLIPAFGSVTFPYPLPFSMYLVVLIEAIYTILLFNQPVNCTLRSITYNGVDISGYITDITPNYLRTSF